MRQLGLTLLIGVPLTLLGLYLIWDRHPGGQLLLVLALCPAAWWLESRHLVPTEALWLVIPLVQFAYYYSLVWLVLKLRAAA
jgi:hypothetical protein